MEPFELFEKTMEIINKQENIKKEKELLDVDGLETAINDGNLPLACEQLHKFLRDDIDDCCFQKEFPISYSFDQLRKAELKKHKNSRSNRLTYLGYDACWEYSDEYDKNDICKKEVKLICCKECKFLTTKLKIYSYADELDHFLTHLLYEQALIVGNKREKKIKSPKNALGLGREAGLFVLATEVLAKGKKRADITDKAKKEIKTYLTTVNNAAKIIKDDMKQELKKKVELFPSTDIKKNDN